MILLFDSETTGVPKDYRAPATDSRNWPRLVQFAWMESSDDTPGDVHSCIVRPDGFTIPAEASAVHGITHQRALAEGIRLDDALGDDWWDAVRRAEFLVGHNVPFDLSIIGAELHRLGRRDQFRFWMSMPWRCTMQAGTDLCRIPGKYGYKWPRLPELYRVLFGREPENQHDAGGDVLATAECYYEMVRRGLFSGG